MPPATKFFLGSITAIFFLALPSPVRAQAPAGPIHPKRTDVDTPAPAREEKKSLPRHDLWAAWILNAKRSDDPKKKMEDPRRPSTWGSYPTGRRSAPDERTHELIDPANSLTLTHKDAEIDVTDDSNRKRALFTDGRKLQKSKDDTYQEAEARWDGPRLVTDEKGPWGMKLTRSFEISPDGQHLYETLAIDRGATGGGFAVIRYVYDPATQAAESHP